MNDTTMKYSGTLVVEACWCGMKHAIPRTLRDHMNRQHENGEKQVGIYCPLGHVWEFSGKSQVEKEREHREATQARYQALRDQLDAEERSHAVTKGQLTKAKKRIGKGVCPCCNRHFTNVERHMATQHPKHASESV